MKHGNEGTTTLSPEQFDLLESLATAGAGPAGVLAGIEVSPLFTQSEKQQIQGKTHGKNGGKGSGGGNGSGGNGGNEWGVIGKLLPMVRKGDRGSQSSSSGLPYSAGTTVNPITSTTPGSTGGLPPIALVAMVGAVAIGAWFIFRKKPTAKKGP
jgi:hypothetical protein